MDKPTSKQILEQVAGHEQNVVAYEARDAYPLYARDCAKKVPFIVSRASGTADIYWCQRKVPCICCIRDRSAQVE